MKILVACEESGKVTAAFRKRGHEAYSVDLMPTRGNALHHWQGDVMEALKHPFDMLIGFPPCTYMTNTANKHLWIEQDRANGPDWERWQGMFAGVWLFKMLWGGHRIPKVVLENPIMNPYAKAMIGMDATQIIQPWMFGHLRTKATCLWLKNTPPPLRSVTNLKAQTMALPEKIRGELFHMTPGPDRARKRSETFQGIADAMAAQWG